MANINGNDQSALDPERVFEQIRHDLYARYGTHSRSARAFSNARPEIEIHENDEGFLVVAWPLATCLGQIELAIEWNEVEIAVPAEAGAAQLRLSQRIGLPAVIDPERTEMIYSGGTLLLRLAKRSPKRMQVS